ncbi:MAG: RsmF rRNA methyltransferase first C-terminal domain-containing protein [Erysipelotrichaceae bacterium]|nr:RsmF rRNA methyltransferase first C-terminal domain-containing protein [Erysipelotrichaceae bacterium]
MSEVTFKDRVKEYFGQQSDEFLCLMKEKPTQAFFLNEKKADRKIILSLIDFEIKESPLSDQSFYYEHENIGKTIPYELGIIYPQEIGASLTSKYIDPEDIKTVVDMCAAPGGKTINILNRLNDDVICISNDFSHARASVLSSNIERTGLDNVIVTNKRCEDLADLLQDKADLVILDAPCSGEGMIRKYPQILDTWSLNNIESLAALQSELLEHAYRMLKNGGTLIYSTCTFAFEEDEDQVSSFLERHEDMSLINIDLPSSSRLNGTVKLSFLDHTEGQFFALMRKKGSVTQSSLKPLKTIKDKTAETFIKENLLLDSYYLYKNNEHFYLSLQPLPDMKYNVMKYGICLGEVIKNRFEPAHDLYRANSLKGKYRYTYDLNDREYLDFISGKEIKKDLEDHYYQLTYRGISIGFGKCAKGTIKNKYPKGLRRMI